MSKKQDQREIIEYIKNSNELSNLDKALKLSELNVNNLKVLLTEKSIPPEVWSEYRRLPKAKIFETDDNLLKKGISTIKARISESFIRKNLKLFIENELGEETDAQYVKDIILRMSKNNSDIFENVDFRIISPKYIKAFGEDKLNLITNFQGIQDKIVNLNDNQLDIFSKCINYYSEKNNTEEWTVIAEEVLGYISSGEYDKLIANIGIGKLKEDEISNLVQIMQGENFCKINTLEDVRNYYDIKKKKCEEIINSEDSTIQEKKDALLMKLFGHDTEYAQKIIKKYGSCIEKIDEGEIKDYVRCLKQLEKIEDVTTLKEIFDNCTFAELDKCSSERKLKNEYCKIINEDLFEPQDMHRIKGNIYDAGTDFKMVITVVRGLVDYDKKVGNYRKDWNRPSLSCQHLSASYIRNDSIRTVRVGAIDRICYGFSEMKEDSLMLAGRTDLESSREGFVSKSEKEEYLDPDGLINNSSVYNEVDYRRIQNGERKNPDYIVVFKKDKKCPTMKEAKKASKDFGNIPIVIVDIDKCLENEQKLVHNMIKEYKKNPNRELAIQILQKVQNNQGTDLFFHRRLEDVSDVLKELRQKYKTDIDMDTDINEGIQQVEDKKKTKSKIGIESLKENYELVSENERRQVAQKIRSIYSKVKSIINDRQENLEL